MKVLIINPPIRLDDKPRNIPHGLAILANILRQKFRCQILFVDWNAYRYSIEKIKAIIKSFPCDVAMIGGLIPTYKYLIKISNIIKKYHPKTKILAGGSAAMSIPKVLLENSMIDVVCTGEGEVTIVRLIESFQQEENPDFSAIRGIAYSDNEGKILVNEPEPLIQNLDQDSLFASI